MELITSIDIYLANGSGPYRPGSVLAGQLQFTGSQSVPCEELSTVKVSCLGLLESVTSGSIIRKRVPDPAIFDDSKQVMFSKSVVILLRPQADSWYHFQFDLPPDLPPSFTSALCTIQYLIEVQTEDSTQTASVPFFVENVVDLNENPLARVPGHFIEHRFASLLSEFLVRSDYVSLEVYIPQRGFIPLEVILFKVKVINQFWHDVKVITLLKQVQVSIARFCGRGMKILVHGCIPILVGDIPLGTDARNVRLDSVRSWAEGISESPPPKYSRAIRDVTSLPSYAEVVGIEGTHLGDQKKLSSWIEFKSSKKSLMGSLVPIR